MAPLKGRLTKEALIGRLLSAPGYDHPPLDKLKMNDLLALAQQLDLVTSEEFDASTSYRERTIKMYLWTLVNDTTHREAIRKYSIVCSELYVFATTLLNLCWLEVRTQGMDEQKVFLEYVMDSFKSGNKSLKNDFLLQLVIPERLAPCDRMPIVQHTLTAHPEILVMLPKWRDLTKGKVSIWDNAVKYIANKISGAIKNHILVHFLARIKASLRRTCQEPKAAIEFFMEGTDMHEDAPLVDVMLVTTYRRRLGCKEHDEVVLSEKVTMDLLRWHLELSDELQTFSPFPVAGTTRTHHIICNRVCQALTGHSLSDVFGLTPGEWKKRLKHARIAKRKRKAGRKSSTARKSGRSYKLTERDVVTSVDTDGCGLGVHVKTPHVHHYNPELDKLDAKKKAKYLREANINKMNALHDPVLLGNDPGGVFLYFMAVENEDGSHDKIRYSREAWRKDIKMEQRNDWHHARSMLPDVKVASDAISESGGYKNACLETWTAYVETLSKHWDVLSREFIHNDDRCRQRMDGFRLRQRALMRAADRVFVFASARKGPNTPIVVGYGDGNVGLGAKGTPVKSLYDAIIAAFKRHKRPGGILKVSERYTTKRCHRCGNDMEAVYGVIDGCWKENRDFRCCASCTDEQRKLRHRDFNAAVNILLVLKAELTGQERPKHLTKMKTTPVGRRKRTAANPKS